ncbi:MAG: hypothetical protein SGI92_12135 [Bryobacteraceae bacterium]|nr:hypothetical protein [Bryobacteraceae bacterium]
MSGRGWTSESRYGYNRTIQDRIGQFFNRTDPKQPNEGIIVWSAIASPFHNAGMERSGWRNQSLGGPLMQVEEKYARYIGKHA